MKFSEQSTANKPEHGGDGVFLRATVSRITYRNADNGFGVLRVELEDGSYTALVGVIPEGIAPGAHLLARGNWQIHHKFGRQFKASSVMESDPTGKDAIVRYLATGPVKGFGPVLAQRIVDLFGEDTLRVIDDNPERLLEVPGIGEKKLHVIKEQWEQKRGLREIMLFFQQHGIGAGLAQRIFKAYGDRAIETVKQNPYILARDIWGVGFKTADRIAGSVGIAPDAPERIRAALAYTLKRGAEDGHCYLPTELLFNKTSALIGVEDGDLLSEGVRTLALEGEVRCEHDRVYLPQLEEAEALLASLAAGRISRRTPDQAISSEAVEEFCNRSMSAPGDPTRMLSLSPDQRRCVELAATGNLLMITGGPGCGKTTVVRAIASLFRQRGLTVRLAAPTGRAAQRLAEVCDMEAATIHRLLKFDPIRRTFLHDEHCLLPLDALIVDECSMIDTPLAASLLRAVPRGARLVMVGDADQLPSVGPGLVLAELLSLAQVPRVALTTLFRRTQESAITHIAHQINASVLPHIPDPEAPVSTDAYFVQAPEQAQAAELIERLVVEQIPRRFGFRGAQITVLSPMNQGDLGVQALNQRLQAKLVPPRAELPSVRVGNLEFRLGDRVCQRVNNYNITAGGVFNGDQGEVIGIDQEARAMLVRLWDGREVEYRAENIPELDLAYAITIHRSQGSEVPVVVLALHDAHTILLERQLVYTAVTRAKKLLIIVGSRRALANAVRRTRSRRRYTALAERVRSELELNGAMQL